MCTKAVCSLLHAYAHRCVCVCVSACEHLSGGSAGAERRKIARRRQSVEEKRSEGRWRRGELGWELVRGDGGSEET